MRPTRSRDRHDRSSRSSPRSTTSSPTCPTSSPRSRRQRFGLGRARGHRRRRRLDRRLARPLLDAWAGRSRHRVTVFSQAERRSGLGAQPRAGARDRGVGHLHRPGRHARPRLPRGRRALRRGAPARSRSSPPSRSSSQERPERIADDRIRAARQYEAGDRVVDLDAGAERLPRQRQREPVPARPDPRAGLRFDTRIRPELRGRPLRGPLPARARRARWSASCATRATSTGSAPPATSTLQRSLSDPGRYTDVLEHRLPRRPRRGACPTGLGPGVAPARADLRAVVVSRRRTTKISSGVLRRTRGRADASTSSSARILRQLDPEVVAAHRVRTLRSVWADLLAHGGRDDAVASAPTRGSKVDRASGRPPAGARIDSSDRRPTRRSSWTGRRFARRTRKTSWPTATTAPISCSNGSCGCPSAPACSSGWMGRRRRSCPAGRATRRTGGGARRGSGSGLRAGQPIGRLVEVSRRAPAAVGRRIDGTALRFAAAPGAVAPAVRGMRGCSWIASTTRTTTASGCSSTCARERPDINAWFVLERGTPDWERMAAHGRAPPAGPRLVHAGGC